MYIKKNKHNKSKCPFLCVLGFKFFSWLLLVIRLMASSLLKNENNEQKMSHYTSISVILSSPHSESCSLLSKKHYKISIKSFITYVIIVIFAGIAIASTGLFFYHRTDDSDLLAIDHEYIDEYEGCATSDIDCNGHGICSALTNQCECDIGYTSFGPSDGTECNYQQKYQMNAFLLSLFLGEFGAGRFYIGDYVLGSIKLMLIFVGCCCFSCAMCVAAGSDSGGWIGCGYGILFCCAFCLGVWCVVDVILFATNNIKDSNGVPLYGW